MTGASAPRHASVGAAVELSGRARPRFADESSVPAPRPGRAASGASRRLLAAVADALRGASALSPCAARCRASRARQRPLLLHAEGRRGAQRRPALRHVPARGAAAPTLPPRRRAVEVRGRLGVYEPRGELQFVVEAMQRVGAGALYERVPAPEGAARGRGPVRRRAQAAAAAVPRAVGVVTSLGGRRAARRADALRAACAARAGGRLSEPGAGRRGAGGAVRGDRARGPARRGRHADRLPRRRLAGGPVGLQRRARRPRDRAPRRCRWCAASATRPTSRSPTSPPTCARHADGGGRARRPGDRAGCCEPLESHRAALAAPHPRRARARGAAARPPALRLARPAETLARRGARPRPAGAAARGRDGSRPGAPRARRSTPAAARAHSLVGAHAARQAARLDAAAIRLDALDPRRVLARGYALLRDDAGHALSSVAQASAGPARRARPCTTAGDARGARRVATRPPAA